MSDDSDIGISRLDQESAGTHGWQVRVQRKGVRYGRFFSDSAWGGREAALETARRFRDRILSHAERGESVGDISSRSRSIPDSRSRSGVVGVTRISQKGPNGVEYRFWQASWTTTDGVRKTIRYSVLKHGDEEAFELACIARREANG